MTLRRVPGFRNYQAEDKGLRAIALGAPMFRFMRGVGEDIASDANAVGQSNYDAQVTTMRVGRENESRASVEIFESNPHWKDARDEILLRILARTANKNGKPR